MEALLHQLVARAFKGDNKAAKLLIDLENKGSGKIEFAHNAMTIKIVEPDQRKKCEAE
jgi:hypothetical protein